MVAGRADRRVRYRQRDQLLINGRDFGPHSDAMKELLGPAFVNGGFNIQLGSKSGIDKLLLLSVCSSR